MKSYDRNFYDLLTQVGQTYIIPSFQRDYSWDMPQWQALWDDIQFLIDNPNKYHYTGSLVYIPSQEHTTYLREVIDGQQRLTTVSLIYLAVYTLLKEGKLDDYNPDSLRVQVLANQYGVARERLKLKPAGTDGVVYEKIFDEHLDELTTIEKQSNVFRGYMFFLENLSESKIAVEDLIGAAQRLQVIEIVLNQDDDHPQKVFESINSTGKQLNVGDLIRNYVLMRGNHEIRERIYGEYWIKIEQRLKRGNDSLLEEFFTTFIKLRLNRDITKSTLYDSFKKIYDDEPDAEAFLTEILVYAGIYQCIKYGQGIYADKLAFLSYYFDVMNLLKIDVFHTFTLPVLRDFLNDDLTEQDTNEVFGFLINYLTRRLLAGRTTTSLNKYAPGLYAKLKKYQIDTMADILIYEFTTNLSAQISYPSDHDVEQGIRTQDFYTRKDNCRYVLLALDNVNRDNRHKNLLKDGTLTIEHVMPQTLTADWRQALGSRYSEVYINYINNLANLTLTAYNSTYSNLKYSEKLHNKEHTGLAESPLLINQFFKTTDEWNEASIMRRQDELVQSLLQVFPARQAKNDYRDQQDDEYVQIDLIGDTTGKVAEACMLFETIYPVESWKELYMTFFEVLSDISGGDEVFSILDSLTTGLPLISKDETAIQSPGRLRTGYFLACSKSSHDLVVLIARYIELSDDVELKDLKIKSK